MSRLATIGRRSFLIGSAAIMGGVAFGTYAVQNPPPNPLAKGLADGAATFNPWVIIDADKVTLVTPHADLGQGVVSAQAALIAEELDIEFGQFETSFGSPAPAYWNTAMSEESVPFMATDDSAVPEAMRGAVGGVLKLLGLQATGGSTSMPDVFVKLREAGAVARETLKLAASQETGVPVGQLTTKGGAVILPDGTEMPYTSLAATAATLTPVRRVTLRDPSDWRLVGKPMQRLDILPKSTGTQTYGIDLSIEGMVHATVCTNPRKGGEMLGYDATEARSMRGVKDVVEITNGVAVVADNTWRAIRAMGTIQFDWGPAPYPAEQDAHWKEIEASFTEARLDQQWRNEGDVDAAQGEEITAEYRSPYVAHQPMEPLNAIVLVTDTQTEIWTGHQFPRQLQVEVGKITGHAPDQVIFHNQYMGGSFGHRLEFDFVRQATEVAMAMKGTPVKMTYSREEDFAQDYTRHPAIGRGRAKVAEGKVVSLDLDIAAPSVIGSQMSRIGLSVPGPDTQIIAGAWNNPYRVENLRMTAYRAPELAPVSSWRAVGAPGAGFIFDTFLDEAIHAAGADPMEERLRLIDHDASRKVLEAVAEISDWGSALAPGQGKGVAFVESFGVPTAVVVQVSQNDHGLRVDKAWAALDVGTVIDPVNLEGHIQGGVVWGLGHAMNSEITYSDGRAQQSNYHAAEGLRIHQCPEITVAMLEHGSKVRGAGEPAVPPTAPALGNAIFAATGQRLRELPFHKFVDFV